MSKRNNSIDLILLKSHVFKATVEAVLKAAGAIDVKIEGAGTKRNATAYLSDCRVTISATWQEETQRRKAALAIDWLQFDHVLADWDVAGVKSYALDIAKRVVFERLEDALNRANVSIPLNHF